MSGPIGILHSMRHFCASVMADRGANEFEISEQLGNEEGRMTIWQRFAAGERPPTLTEVEVRAVHIPGSPLPSIVEWHRDGVDLYYGWRRDGQYHLELYSQGALERRSDG